MIRLKLLTIPFLKYGRTKTYFRGTSLMTLIERNNKCIQKFL